MYRHLMFVIVISLAGGLPAYAQAPGVADTGAPAPAPAGVLKPGMAVKDRTGAMVGVIREVAKTADGRPVVVISVDGQPISTLASNLKLNPNQTEAISAYTKAQLQAAAAAAKPPG
jgi:hypothetical protein